MPISMPVTMVLTARNPNSHTQMGIIAILLHGEFGWPLSYLVAGFEVVNVEVSVTDSYGCADIGDCFRDCVETMSVMKCGSVHVLKTPQL
jgi:hypothetical protein